MYADLFNSEGDLVTLFGFEATYPGWGQANHYFIDRSISPIARRAGLTPTLEAALDLYDKEGLAGKVMVARHYHGIRRNIRLNAWRPAYEPVFEVVQIRGFCFGVLESILGQGIKMGVVGGTDHAYPPGGNMPYKYANAATGLWAKAATREEVFAALAQRRSYATNGTRMRLFFQMDGHLMGDEYTTTGVPSAHIRAEATPEICSIELLRDGKPILSQTNCGRKANVEFVDRGVVTGDHYYYVKMVQTEEPFDNYQGIAVTSAIWVHKTAVHGPE